MKFASAVSYRARETAHRMMDCNNGVFQRARLLLGGCSLIMVASAPEAWCQHRVTISSVTLSYADLVHKWREHQDAGLVAALAQYRRHRADGRRWEVVYMIATTLCRSTAPDDVIDKTLGDALFRSIEREYERELRERGIASGVEGARQACWGQAAVNPSILDPAAVLLLRTATAGIDTRSKLYHFLCDASKAASVSGPVANEMAETAKTIPIKTLGSRIFPRAAIGSALAAARARAAGLGPGWVVDTGSRFVLATMSGHSAKARRQILRDLEAASNYYERRYGLNLPDTLINIYLVPSTRLLRRTAQSLHGLRTPQDVIGYSTLADASIVAIIPGMTYGTLYHELMHLHMRYSFADAPPWLDEGLAALYEVADATGDSLAGKPNWRGDVLRAYGGKDPAYGIGKMFQLTWSEFDGVPFDYYGPTQGPTWQALARYFVLYLQEQGQLENVVRMMRGRDRLAEFVEQRNASSVADLRQDTEAVLEQSTNRHLDELIPHFATWLDSVLPPARGSANCRNK